MNKKEAEEITSEMMMADVLLRLKSLENILVTKGILVQEEYLKEMETVAQHVAKSLLEKAQVKGGLDELIDALNSNKGN